MVLLKNLEHLLPTPERRIYEVDASITPIKISTTQSKKNRNQGLLQFIIELIKLHRRPIVARWFGSLNKKVDVIAFKYRSYFRGQWIVVR